MPTVNVLVGVLGCEMSVFQVTVPPVLGSGKDSMDWTAMVSLWRTIGLIVSLLGVVVLIVDRDMYVVRRGMRIRA
jgi:hypothetical protein